MVRLKVKACGFMKLACIFVGCFFCLFVFQIFFRRTFLTFVVRSPTIIGIVRPQCQNDNHHPADNNVDGQELDWMTKESLSMVITTESVHLKDRISISGNKDCNMTWLTEFTRDKGFPTDIPNEADELYFFVISDWECFTKLCKWNRQACRNLSHNRERYFATTFKIQTMERWWHFRERYESIHCPDILFWNIEKAKLEFLLD